MGQPPSADRKGASIDHVPHPTARERLAESLGRLVANPAHTGAWARIALVGVALLAATLYVWNLTVSGYANVYYSAAAQAGSQSWSAWFFGSVDASNFITIDKPPLATMLMGISVRLFGLSSWSILLPEALLGVATVVVLFRTVRSVFGPMAATIAGVVLALSPAAVLIFRYNNPDALLTFLLVAAVWATQRALLDGRRRWLVLAGVCVGLAFNAKFLQAYLVVPALVSTWLVAGPVSLRRRMTALVPMAIAGFVASAWWVAIVQLVPAADRPFVGGSLDGSPLDLLFNYDGFGRLTGEGGTFYSGAQGVLRLLNDQFGGQIGWFLPLAVLALGAGLWLRRSRARTDPRRAAYLLWGGWLIVHATVFSVMTGTIHSYYAVVLAPPIGALVGSGLVELWRLRARSALGGLVLAGAMGASGIWATILLARTPEFAPWIVPIVAVTSVAGAAVLALPELRANHLGSLAPAGVALAALLAGPAAYAADTMTTAYSGGTPAAGPAVASQSPGQDGRGFDNGVGQPGPGGAPGQAGFGRGDGGGNGNVSDSLARFVVDNRGHARWIAAVSSANQAYSLQLSTGLPTLSMGGFTGRDPAPTLSQFKSLVAAGDLRYLLVTGNADSGNATIADITSWAAASCSVVEDNGSSGTLYDCSTAGLSP